MLSTPAAKRDNSKPIIFTPVNDNNIKSPSLPGNALINQVFEITQDSRSLGRVKTVVTGGEFGKAIYVFWKFIKPHVVNGINLTYLPIAISNVSPNSFGAATEVVTVLGKQVLKIAPGAYQSMENSICSALIAKRVIIVYLG